MDKKIPSISKYLGGVGFPWRHLADTLKFCFKPLRTAYKKTVIKVLRFQSQSALYLCYLCYKTAQSCLELLRTASKPTVVKNRRFQTFCKFFYYSVVLKQRLGALKLHVYLDMLQYCFKVASIQPATHSNTDLLVRSYA